MLTLPSGGLPLPFAPVRPTSPVHSPAGRRPTPCPESTVADLLTNLHPFTQPQSQTIQYLLPLSLTALPPTAYPESAALAAPRISRAPLPQACERELGSTRPE